MPITSRIIFSSGSTIDSANRIGTVVDSLGLVANFTQATDANKPILTRADNKGNLLRNSHVVGSWSSNTGITVASETITATAATANHAAINTTTGFLANMAVTGQSYRQIIEVEYVNYQWCWIGNGGDSSWRGVRVDLQNGLIDASFNLTSSSIVTVSPNRYRIILVMPQATISNHSIYVTFGTASIANGSTSTTTTGTEQIKVYYGVSQNATWDSDIITTTTFPQIVGVNGRIGAWFSGAQSLATTSQLSAFYTNSASCIYIVVKPDLLGSEHQMTRASAAGHFAVRTKSADGFYFINDDGTARYSTSPLTATAGNVYIIRGRHASGNIFCAIDTGNGYSEGSPVACGNATTMTATYMLGANAGTSIYGTMLEVVTYNEGTPQVAMENELREEYLTSGRLTFNPLTGKFSRALTASAKVKEMLLNSSFPFFKGN